MSVKRAYLRLWRFARKMLYVVAIFLIMLFWFISSHSLEVTDQGWLSEQALPKSKAEQNLHKNLLHEAIEIPGTSNDGVDLGPSSSFMQEGTLGIYELSGPKPVESNYPGRDGKPVQTDLDTDDVKAATKKFGFNTVASDLIPMNRTVPDVRNPECKFWHYPQKLPTATVIIVFHNEAWSPLLRTVYSAINGSPKELLKEVLLVDDFSNHDHLKDRLDVEVKRFNGKVRLVRNKKREGLIGSRCIGAKEARGDVVVFLDAHCEVNMNWLPPLLSPIADNPDVFLAWDGSMCYLTENGSLQKIINFFSKVMTVPYIDRIDSYTWEYQDAYSNSNTELSRGIFEWGLLYKEKQLPAEQDAKRRYKTEPVKAPTHAGGLFAIDRNWFEQLGYYDPGLQIWGGENFELSFKIWMCGGGIYWIPCSRVGHVYRQFMPYDFGGLKGPIVSENYKRVAEVWMDEYKENYYRREPFIRTFDIGNLSAQKALREKNKCKSFKWFVDNVAYDMLEEFPLLPDNVEWGEVSASVGGNTICLDINLPVPAAIHGAGCHHRGGNQLFRLNEKGQLAQGEWCITPQRASSLVGNHCTHGTVDGPWKYDKTDGTLKDARSNLCVTAEETNRILLTNCTPGNENQKWTFSNSNLKYS